MAVVDRFTLYGEPERKHHKESCPQDPLGAARRYGKLARSLSQLLEREKTEVVVRVTIGTHSLGQPASRAGRVLQSRTALLLWELSQGITSVQTCVWENYFVMNLL